MLVNTLPKPGSNPEPGADVGGGPRALPFSDLARGLGELKGHPDVLVRGLAIDSRAVVPGTCFVARRGLHVDGHRFVVEAVAQGAVALVVETVDPDVGGLDVPILRVAAADIALAHLACRFYAHPSHELSVVGVTGTNGKTTTTHLVAGAFAAGGSDPRSSARWALAIHHGSSRRPSTRRHQPRIFSASCASSPTAGSRW